MYVVTGASGKLGSAVVQRLQAAGNRVRTFQRSGGDVTGDLGDREAVDRALKGAVVVIHCGATMHGDWEAHRRGTVIGTQNVIDACKAFGVKQLVHVSSLSVVDWAGTDGGTVTEATPLEPRAEERGFYTRAKLEAEQRVADSGIPAVILRPGQIFGGGIPLITGAVARDVAGRWLVLGDGTLELPLVYIDDVVDAIERVIAKRLVGREVIQLVDPEKLTQNAVLALVGDKPIVRIPRRAVFAAGRFSELPSRVLKRPSPIAEYRLQSALARLHFASDRAETLLGWKPRVGLREGITRSTGTTVR